MTILAITRPGEEFLYKVATAHNVNQAKAKKIADMLNNAKYMLKDGEIWYPYEVDEYDTAYDFAQFQRFEYGKRGLIRRY